MKNEHFLSVLVLGMGNDILSDDGIGPRIINDLDKTGMPPWVTFKDASAGGMELIETIKDYDEVILIDALKTGVHPPGTVLEVVPADFGETLHLSNIHDIDFLTALKLGQKAGMKIPERMTILAVEIVEDRVFSNDFSESIQSRYPGILQEVRKRLCTFLCGGLG